MKILYIILLLFTCSKSFSQSSFDCSNIPYADEKFLNEWNFINTNFLGVEGKNVYNNKINVNVPAKGLSVINFWFINWSYNWSPHFSKKLILSGELKNFYLYEVNKIGEFIVEDGEKEEDWNINIKPTLQSIKLLETVIQKQKNGDFDFNEWERDGDDILITGEISPSDIIIMKNKYFDFKLNKKLVVAKKYNSATIIDNNRICIYGPFVGDERHNMRPEIHPAELLWFKNPKSGFNQDSITMIILQDGSYRFDDKLNDYQNDEEEDFTPWVESPIYAEFKYAFEIDINISNSFNLCIEDNYNTYSEDIFKNLNNKDNDFLKDKVTELIFNNNKIGIIHQGTYSNQKIGVSFDTARLVLNDNGKVLGFLEIRVVVSNLKEDKPGYAFLNLSVKNNPEYITEQIISRDKNILASNEDYNRILNDSLSVAAVPKDFPDTTYYFSSSNLINPQKVGKNYNIGNSFSLTSSKVSVLNDINSIELIKTNENGKIEIENLQKINGKNIITTKEQISIMDEAKLKYNLNNKESLIAFLPGVGLDHKINLNYESSNKIFGYENMNISTNKKADLLNKKNENYENVNKVIVDIIPYYYNKIENERTEENMPIVNSFNNFIDSLYSKDKKTAENRIAEYFGESKNPINIKWKHEIKNSITGQQIQANNNNDEKVIINYKSENDLTKNSKIEYRFGKNLSSIPIVIENTGIITDSFGKIDTIKFKVFNYKIRETEIDSDRENLIKEFFYEITANNGKDSTEYWKLANTDENELSIDIIYGSDYLNANFLKTYLSNLFYFEPDKLSDIETLINYKFE